MKKKVISILLSTAMTAVLLAGCGDAAQETAAPEAAEEAPAAEEEESTAGTEEEAPETTEGGSGTYAIITKAAGNPYNEKEAEGFAQAVEEMGGTAIVQHPEAATADAQISVIQSLISQGVDSIAIAGNDINALQAALEEAAAAGIKVCSIDSGVNPESRLTHVNQAGTMEIGQCLMDAVYDIAGGEGQWAILSATSQAANQNAWIDAMKTIMEEDDKYADLELVEVAYGDDDAHSCPYMFLWNPIDIGRLGAYTSIALANGEIGGAAGDTFTAGDLGDYTIVEAGDGGTEVILGPPYRFDPSNIEEWKTVY